MPLMNIGEYARHRGVDPKAVRVAVQMGRITRRPDGLFDQEEADAEWGENTNDNKAHDNRNVRREEETPTNVVEMAAPELPTELPASERSTKGSDYAKARAATQIYEARLKKLRYEERAKSLVPARDVEHARFQEFRILRDACANIPARIAAQLSVEHDITKCYAIVEAEINAVFQDFAEGKIA